MKGCDKRKITDESHERAERRGEGAEGKVCEGFAERRETSMKQVLADVFDPNIEQREVAKIA